MYNRGKIIKWLGLKPLVRSTINVELIQDGFTTKPIDYTHINHMGCKKVGTHLDTFNKTIGK